MVITTYLNKIGQDNIGEFEGGGFSLFQISHKEHLELILSKNEMVYIENKKVTFSKEEIAYYTRCRTSHKNIFLYYLENDENYISICYIGEKEE